MIVNKEIKKKNSNIAKNEVKKRITSNSSNSSLLVCVFQNSDF